MDEVDWDIFSPTSRSLFGPLLRYYSVTGECFDVQGRQMKVIWSKKEQMFPSFPVMQVVLKTGRGGKTEPTIWDEYDYQAGLQEALAVNAGGRQSKGCESWTENPGVPWKEKVTEKEQ